MVWLLLLPVITELLFVRQAFINTARKIYEKIETGVFDVSNEVSAASSLCLLPVSVSQVPTSLSCVCHCSLTASKLAMARAALAA